MRKGFATHLLITGHAAFQQCSFQMLVYPIKVWKSDMALMEFEGENI